MTSLYISVLLILYAVNNAKAINYASYRVNDTVSIDVTRDTPRTTREILVKLNNVQISSPDSMQDATEHLLQFAALLRTKILDTFGLLIYDYYDDFDNNEMHALYQIYQDTLERKWNIFDIVPNVLINLDLKPSAICNYINYHAQTCLRQLSYTCSKSKFPDTEHEQDNETSSILLAKSIYETAKLDEKYPNGISLPIILDYLKNNRLQFTAEIFSGLLHNVHYDDYDDGVRTAERELIHYFLNSGRRSSRKNLLKPQTIKQYVTVTRLLKGFLQSHQFPLDVKRHAEYLAEHISRDSSAISENIELIGAAYEDGDINLRYLFELVLPDDAHDSDIIDARNYLIEQMFKQNIMENYLRVEKYQQSSPNQMLMGILGQLRDIDFITDIATSLQLHARYWHSSHMIENLNQLLELFDAYENLRDIPEHKKLISTIDKLRKKLFNSNNATIEMSCTIPRNCLRIGLNVILQCNGINKETKKLINRFLNKSNFQCINQKLMDKSTKSPENHETVSKKPIVTTTRKNLEHLLKAKKVPVVNLTTETPVSTKESSNPNCKDDEQCDIDDVLATGAAKVNDANITAELNISAVAGEKDIPEIINLSTVSPSVEVPTELLQSDNLVHDTIPNPVENTIVECNNLTCPKNETETQEPIIIVTTASSDVEKIVTDPQIKHQNILNSETPLLLSPSTTRIPLNKVSDSAELIATTTETIVTTSKPTCQHRDLHYRQKLRRLEKIDKSSLKSIHRGDLENFKVNDANKETISMSATNSIAESNGIVGQAQAKDQSKLESVSNIAAGTGHSEKIIEVAGDNSKTSGHGASISVESGSIHTTGNAQHSNKIDDKNSAELKKKLQADIDALASIGSDSSAEDKLKKRLQSSVDVSASVERDTKHENHHSLIHSGHIKKLLASEEAMRLKKKLLGGHDDLALSIENDSAHAKHKLGNKELLRLLSKRKNLSSGSRHHTHVLEAAESKRELSGHHELSDSSSGGATGRLHHSRRNLGKTEEASTTEHRRKITQQYRESSRRNSKKSSRTNSTKGKLVKSTTSEEPSEFLSSEKHAYGSLSKSDLFSPSEEIVLPMKSNDTDSNRRLFDWNTPLGSNYDIAMNEKPPEKVYYRPKRGLPKGEKKNVNKNANFNQRGAHDDIDSRLFDVNLPFFSNYDVALNDKLPNQRRSSRVTRDTTTIPNDTAEKNDTSVKKKDLNDTDQPIADRLFDFNMPMGSNQKWRFNAPETPAQESSGKHNYRSRRDTTKKNDTHVDSKALNITNNGTSSSNDSSIDVQSRFLDLQASFSVNNKHSTTTTTSTSAAISTTSAPDDHKTTTTSKNSTDSSTVGIDKSKSRKRRELLQFHDDDDEEYGTWDKFNIHESDSDDAKSRKERDTPPHDDSNAAESRRNVETLYSRIDKEPQSDEHIGQRLFDFNLPMGSNQKWRFNAPEPAEKKNYRSRRNADATTTTTTTPNIGSTTTNSPLSGDKNVSNNHTNNNNNGTTVINTSTTSSSATTTSNTLPGIELRMGNDNSTITDSNTTEKINTTTVAKQ